MEAQTIVCANCQNPNPAKNLYCQSCGKPLVQSEIMPTTSYSSPAVAVMPEPAEPGQTPIQSENQAPGESQGLAPVFPPQLDVTQTRPAPQAFPPTPPTAQPAYYAPPPPPPPPSPSLEKLGVRTDGWTELVRGAGEKVDDVVEAFLASMSERALPQVTIETVNFSGGPYQKTYQVVRSSHGSITVKIAAVGKDLSIGWSLYTRRILNIPMLGILAAIAFGVSFLTSLNMTVNFGYFFVSWVFGTFRWLLDTAILAMIAGYVWKGSFWHFFLQNDGEIARDELTGICMSVHSALLFAIEEAGLDVTKLRGKAF